MKFEDVSRLPHLTAAMGSFLPGFSFGSELFLILGTFKEAFIFALIMLIFRVLLVAGGITVALSLYGHPAIARFLEKYLLRGASSLRDKMESSFSLAHMPFVGALVLLSIFDVTMIQFIPWKKSRFFDESKGYPTMGSLKFCMTVKTIQSLASVMCQSAYLYLHTDLSDPTVSLTAKILFISNIIFSAMGAIMNIILLCMKQELLTAVEKEEAEKAKKEEKNIVVDEESQGDEHALGLPASGDPADLAVNANPLHESQQRYAAREEVDGGNGQEEIDYYYHDNDGHEYEEYGFDYENDGEKREQTDSPLHRTSVAIANQQEQAQETESNEETEKSRRSFSASSRGASK